MHQVVSAAVEVGAFVVGLLLLARFATRSGGRGGRRQQIRIRGHGRHGLLGWGLVIVTKILLLLGRFAVGAPLNGRPRTDATFLSAGDAEVPKSRPWWGLREPTRWAYAAGWKRALARWGLLALAAAWVAWPTLTRWAVALVGAVLLGLAANRRWQRFKVAKLHRELVDPLFQTLVTYLGISESERADDWVEIPSDWQTNRATEIVMHYPDGWDVTPTRKARIEDVVARFIGADWDVDWGTWAAVWRRAPLPPGRVELAEIEQRAPADLFKVPVGIQARGRVGIVDMRTESPHWFVTAPPGGGKSSLQRIPISRYRSRGGLVDIIDFKQDSFSELEGVPGVRIHTHIGSAVFALSEFYVSMKGAQRAMRLGTMTEDQIPPRLLVIDEFGSFMTLARSWWARYKQRTGKKGDPPFLDAFLVIGMQGRAGNHRMVVGVHDAEARLFGGTGARDLFMYRAMIGPYTGWKWRKTFGKAPQIDYDHKIPGRGVLGLGENDVHQTQYAWISREENRARCLRAPAPPGWFQNYGLAPWATPEVIEQAADEVGIEIVSPRDANMSSPEQTEGDIPPGPPQPPDAQQPPTPESDADQTPSARDAETAEEYAQETVSAHGFGTSQAATAAGDDVVDDEPVSVPALQLVRPDQEPWIAGYQAAAQYLTAEGWEMTAASFKRIRNKEKNRGNPISGESRTEDDRPCWKPSELVAWQARRKIAGKRQFKTPISRISK